ncbi:hypothetical protein HUT18_24620 [Streptomyces sp. NA04227]|uniref:hypothetical protein n=1 Tax=Streptomyces sp. NA04227 TaxID=2742136 RepID=UPI0015904D31|nr:hypothetical protein [Streptomyces sp. NA04227]QKW09091.1 hypothetical protein HUT18_24620 [Streptomyces sp. NA04227]
MARTDRPNPMSHPNRPPRTAAEQAVAEVEAAEITDALGEEEWGLRPGTATREAFSPDVGNEESLRGGQGGRGFGS